MSGDFAWLSILLGTAIGGYLLGAVNSSLIISALGKLPDPRGVGSGNPGATNMFRAGGRVAAVLTLLGDAGKGAIAVALASAWGHSLGGMAVDILPLVAGIMAVIGHVWPVYHRFRGGKGVATLGGVLVIWEPWLAGLWLGVWLIGFGGCARVAGGSVLSAIAAPVGAFALGMSAEWVIASGILGMLVVYRHQDNMAHGWKRFRKDGGNYIFRLSILRKSV